MFFRRTIGHFHAIKPIVRLLITPLRYSRMDRIRIISRDNGAGLSRDLKLMKEVLTDTSDAEVETVGFGSAKTVKWWWMAKSMAGLLVGSRTGTQIFAERVYRGCLPLAERNMLVPNPEWFLPKWLAHLPRFDMVLCKTHHAEKIFGRLGCNTRYIGFTSQDRYEPGIPRQRAFFHLAGHSSAKGTQVLLDAWRRHPEWPLLTVVQHKADTQPLPSARNIDHRVGHMDDASLRHLQNLHLFHICPSEAEGFGHCLMEGLSVGAVVITTDGEPMNELVTPDHGILIPPARLGTRLLALCYYVDTQGIETAVAKALALSPSECKRIGDAARTFFIRSDRSFRVRLPSVLVNDAYRVGTGYRA